MTQDHLVDAMKYSLRSLYYLWACRAYKYRFGKLPCGRARTSRLKKKRRKIVMSWFTMRRTIGNLRFYTYASALPPIFGKPDYLIKNSIV